MGIEGSQGIFQLKMSNLMSVLEYVRVYFNDLLVFTKDSFKDNLEKFKC